MSTSSSKYYWSTCIVATALVAFDPTLAFGSGAETIRLSKEQIREDSSREFIRPMGLPELLASKIKQFFVTATSRQSGNNTVLRDLAASTRELSHSEWQKKMASLSFDPDQQHSRMDEELVKRTIFNQSQKAVEVTLKRSFPVFEQFKRGLTFNLDVLPRKTSSGKKIRYGLIEKDILPSAQPIQLAAYGNINELYRSYATPARVLYTIDKIEDPSESKDTLGIVEKTPSAEDKNFSWKHLPNSGVVLKIDAAGADDYTRDQTSSVIPGIRLKVTQVQGLISSQVVVGGQSLEKSLQTEISLPIVDGIKISQRLDHKFRLTQVVASGVFEGIQHSKLNILYTPTANNLRGELLFTNYDLNYGVTMESSKFESADRSRVLRLQVDRFSLAMQKNL